MTWLISSWRIVVAVAVIAGAWYVVHQLQENKELVRANNELRRGVDNLNARLRDIETTVAANEAADTVIRDQAGKGVARNETARRSHPDVIAIDKPWPAALRGRVFDDPDPASGSTAAAQPAPARKR